MAPAELKELQSQIDDLENKGVYQKECFTLGNFSVIYEKERWQHKALYRLQGFELGDHQE